MNSNKKESVFWSLAKETNLIEMSESTSVINDTEELLKDTKHFTESAFTIMEQICVLKEKKRILKLEKINFSHQKRYSLIKKQYDEGISEIADIKVELEFALHRNNIILHLLQTASKARDSLPIPIHLQEAFVTIIKDLVRITTMKVHLIECFKKLSVAYNDLHNMLNGMLLMKQKVLQNISLYNSALYNIIELDKEVDDLGVFLTTCVISFLGDSEPSSMNI